MSTAAFIALQCFQCSTMQVKQRKKSSNNWTCVVCNKRQSMRHVFAQGPMARDIRKFVQTFNMSRQFNDQNFEIGKTLTPSLTEELEFSDQKKKKKRTDWCEYVDYEPQIADEIEDVDEPKIVTELPKALFRKPKLSTSASRLGNENGGTDFKPVFSKRKSADTTNIQDKEASKYYPATFSKAPKWSDNTCKEKEPTCNWAFKFRAFSGKEIENDRTLKTVPNHLHSTSAEVFSKWGKSENLFKKEILFSSGKAESANVVSKWDKYVTIGEDHYTPQPIKQKYISDRARRQSENDVIFDVSLHDKRVEEDIHPDFQ